MVVQPSSTMPLGGRMSKSRREFLTLTSLGVLGAGALGSLRPQTQTPGTLPPGAPPAFGMGRPVGPEVSPATFAEGEKLVQFEMADSERAMAAASWRRTMASLYERRTGSRKLGLEASLAPATKWDPVLPGEKAGPARDQFVRSNVDPGPLPANDE